MKLDMDLIRKLLIWCEDRIPAEGRSYCTADIEIKGYTHCQIVNHVKLLVDNGYLSATDLTAYGEDKYYIFDNLTLDGHQFLGLIRNDNLWKHINEIFGKVGLATLPVVITQVAPYIKQLLGIPSTKPL